MSDAEVSAEEGSVLSEYLISFVSFLTRMTIKLGITIGLIASVVITFYHLGQLGKDAIKERKCLMDLIYWRDPKKSGIVLGSIVILLLVFATYPLISVLSYLGLAVLGGTLGFRLYKIAEAQLKKNDGSNPFQPYLEKEVSVPQERVHQQVDVLVEYGQWTFDKLKRLFLVENIAESAKFGLLLWAMTYVGSWFSGLCILLLVVIGVFTIPKVYDTYQEPIDQNLAKVKEQVDKANKIMNEKVPFLKKFTGTVEQHEKST